jgi:hypothetical protein
MAAGWYYAKGTEPIGPMSLADLISVLARLPDAAEVLLWQSGLKKSGPYQNLPHAFFLRRRSPQHHPTRLRTYLMLQLLSGRNQPAKPRFRVHSTYNYHINSCETAQCCPRNWITRWSYNITHE